MPLAALIGDVARLYLEVESGRRPAAQLRGLLTHRLAAQLEQVWVRPGAPGVVLTTTGSRTAPDVFEGVAVVRRGERVGAIAICLIRRRGRWFVAAASRPEDGVLPEPEWPIPDDEEDALDKLDAHDAPATPEADTSTRGGIAPLSLV